MNIDYLRLFNILKKISFSIGDQGIYSLANFLLNIFLLRWLSLEDYGVYAFGFSAFLFLSGFHNALILEPISVLATGNHKSHLLSYLSIQMRLHFIVVIGLGLICIFISGMVSFISEQISMSLLYAGISTPFLLSFWFFRRLCYIQTNPLIAVIGSSIYSSSLIIFLILFHYFEILSPIFAFLIMSLSSFFSSIMIWLFLRKILLDTTPKVSLPIREVVSEQWNYSKWVAGVAILYWINSFIAIPALGIFIGLQASGILRGLQNIILPLQQIGAAMGNIFVPWFSAQDHTNKNKILKLSNQTIFGFSILGIMYLIPILLIPEKILALLYNEVQMNNYIHEVRLIGVVGFITIIIASLSFILQGLKKPNGIFWANCFGSLFSIIVTIPLILKKGIFGAIEGSIITLTIILIILSYFYFRSYLEKNEEI
jgi:O-antigen/teichoic acid export membrane protein